MKKIRRPVDEIHRQMGGGGISYSSNALIIMVFSYPNIFQIRSFIHLFLFAITENIVA